MSKSRSLNKVILIGNLTRDPVLKDTASGVTVCTFGLATNESWKDAQGSEKERAEFHSIVAWNKLAEVCAQILSVGMLVYVEGGLRTRVWVDEAGTKHYRTEVKLEDMILLDAKGKVGIGAEEAQNLADTTKDDKLEAEPELTAELPAEPETADDNLF